MTRITIASVFITDTTGNKFDGNADGTAGDNTNFFFGRGTKLTYVDRDGDKVTLSVKNGGVLELLRDFGGEAESITLLEDTGSSVVTGILKKTRQSAGSTGLAFIGRADAAQFSEQFVLAS